MIDAMFPPERPTETYEREWQNNPTEKRDMEIQNELNRLMTGFLDEVKERKRKKQPRFDWMLEFAIHFVDRYGNEKAMEI